MSQSGESDMKTNQMIDSKPASELAANRTALAFTRTRLAGDRTLLAVIRTALALIGFGFTIFKFFHTLNDKFLEGVLPAEAPRRFGLTLVVLGLTILLLGMVDHFRQTKQLNQQRQHLFELGISHRIPTAKISTSVITACLLFVLGALAIARIAFSIGPL